MTSQLLHNKKVSLHYTVTDQAHGLFPVKGQGTVSVSLAAPGTELRIVLSDSQQRCLGLTITSEYLKLWLGRAGDESTLERSTAPALLLEQDTNVPYWLSLDSQNRRIRYGKGEMMRDLMLFEYTWSADQNTPLNDLTKNLQVIDASSAQVDYLKILECPVTVEPSPHIVPSSAVTMETIATGSACVIDDLPEECKQLYANVAGPGMNLAPADFPEFAQAIQYSIVTPGAMCYEKLKEKDPEFGYLRVTLDANMGDSPGQPYVLEIWPAGNGSPIHDHGNACAVIKVLHGQIQIAWYSALSPQISTPWGSTIAHAGDVTYLTPDYYQIHRLFNPSPKNGGGFCATIQCYRYLDSDRQHYGYFDYIEDGQIKQFDPDSDWTYLDFKRLIKEEWTAAMEQAQAA